MGLGADMHKMPFMLSGGERQRVAIARALALDPDIILMDEPFSALDPNTRVRLRQQLVELWQETGKTILFVTHDVDEALFLADRIVVLSPKPARVVHTLTVDAAAPAAGRDATARSARSGARCLRSSIRRQRSQGRANDEIDEIDEIWAARRHSGRIGLDLVPVASPTWAPPGRRPPSRSATSPIPRTRPSCGPCATAR